MHGLPAFASWFLQGGSQVFGQDVIALLEGRAEIGLVAVDGDFRSMGGALDRDREASHGLNRLLDKPG
jgi:hypothetical protein